MDRLAFAGDGIDCVQLISLLGVFILKDKSKNDEPIEYKIVLKSWFGLKFEMHEEPTVKAVLLKLPFPSSFSLNWTSFLYCLSGTAILWWKWSPSFHNLCQTLWVPAAKGWVCPASANDKGFHTCSQWLPRKDDIRLKKSRCHFRFVTFTVKKIALKSKKFVCSPKSQRSKRAKWSQKSVQCCWQQWKQVASRPVFTTGAPVR